MNEEELAKNLKKTFAQIDVASEIYRRALTEAIKIVDEYLPFKEEADKAKIQSVRHDNNIARSEAISAVVANLLTLSGEVRL